MRETRNLSNYTKQQISNSLKKYHAHKPEQAKMTTRAKQSIAMKNYWSTVPNGDDLNTSTKACAPANLNQSTSKIVQPTKKF